MILNGFAAKGFVRRTTSGYVVTPLGVEWARAVDDLRREVAAL